MSFHQQAIAVLLQKMANPEEAVLGEWVIDADVYSHTPEDLAAIAGRRCLAPNPKQEAFWFFTRMISNERTNRGCSRTVGKMAWWKTTVGTVSIKNDDNSVIGQLMKFEYMVRCRPGDKEGIKTEWLMWEYRATPPDGSGSEGSQSILKNGKRNVSDWALCKIYKTARKKDFLRRQIAGTRGLAETLTQNAADDVNSSAIMLETNEGLDLVLPTQPQEGGFVDIPCGCVSSVQVQDLSTTTGLRFHNNPGNGQFCFSGGDHDASLVFDTMIHFQPEDGFTYGSSTIELPTMEAGATHDKSAASATCGFIKTPEQPSEVLLHPEQAEIADTAAAQLDHSETSAAFTPNWNFRGDLQKHDSVIVLDDVQIRHGQIDAFSNYVDLNTNSLAQQAAGAGMEFNANRKSIAPVNMVITEAVDQTLQAELRSFLKKATEKMGHDAVAVIVIKECLHANVLASYLAPLLAKQATPMSSYSTSQMVASVAMQPSFSPTNVPEHDSSFDETVASSTQSLHNGADQIQMDHGHLGRTDQPNNIQTITVMDLEDELMNLPQNFENSQLEDCEGVDPAALESFVNVLIYAPILDFVSFSFFSIVFIAFWYLISWKEMYRCGHRAGH